MCLSSPGSTCPLLQPVRAPKCCTPKYTSIDPKQFQKGSFRPILVKNDFSVRPTPQKNKLLYQWSLSASTPLITLIVPPQENTTKEQDTRTQQEARPQSSGARLVSVARAGQRGQRTKEGQEEDKTPPQSPAAEFRGVASQCVQGWSARPEEKDKGGQDPATEFRGAASQCVQGWSARPEEKDKGGQDPATEFRGAASQCVQGWSARPKEKDKGGQPGHRARPQGQSVWPAPFFPR